MDDMMVMISVGGPRVCANYRLVLESMRSKHKSVDKTGVQADEVAASLAALIYYSLIYLEHSTNFQECPWITKPRSSHF